MGFSYPEISHQCRLIQCIALTAESLILFTESDRVGLYFIVPLTIHLANLYHTLYRHYYNIDGRFDMGQMLSVNDLNLKGRYAFAAMGSFILAVLGHFSLREISSAIYHFADYLSLASSAFLLIDEVFETLKSKIS